MKTWYIISRYVDKPNYTAHLDPMCGWLRKKGDPVKKNIRIRFQLGVHSPCKSCAPIDYKEMQQWILEVCEGNRSKQRPN